MHGIYADRFLSLEEPPLFEAIIGQLYQDFVFNNSSDFLQVELVAVYFLKLGRVQEAGDWDAAERLDRMIRWPSQGTVSGFREYRSRTRNGKRPE